jgi:hypothetical protein
VDRLGFAVEPFLDLVDRLPRLRAGGKRPLHPLDRPEQVHGGRPRGGHELANPVELGGELLGAGRAAPAHPDCNAHRGCHADRRRAADYHRLDRARDLRRRLAADVDLLRRQLALVDHDDDVVFPRYCWKHDSRELSSQPRKRENTT